jgi:hypothetical protein
MSSSDYERLSAQQKAVLNIKLDGHIEASVAAARALNLGLSECLRLSLRATVRELKAHGIDANAAFELWSEASAEVYEREMGSEARAIN